MFGVSRFVPRFARVGAWDGSGALVRDGTVIDKVCDASKEMTMTVEIAVQDVEGARIAHEEGADRVELCAALMGTGGLTPSFGMIQACSHVGVPQGVQVLIRPRGGSFAFTDEEKNVQIADVRSAILAGASGVVVGGMTEDGRIDVPFTRALRSAAVPPRAGRGRPQRGRALQSQGAGHVSSCVRHARRSVRRAGYPDRTWLHPRAHLGWRRMRPGWSGPPAGAVRIRRGAHPDTGRRRCDRRSHSRLEGDGRFICRRNA